MTKSVTEIMNPILIDLPEVIETSRLKLQMPRGGYGEKAHEAIMDGYEDYVRWLNWSPIPPSQDSVEEDCRKHHAEFILREAIRYLILDKQGNMVGRCGFPPTQTNWLIPQFGIGYFIRKSERSKGYAVEAVHAMTRLAFEVLNAKKVEIYCDAENKASIRIPLKLGFQLEYCQKGGWPRADDQLAELQTYSLFCLDDLTK